MDVLKEVHSLVGATFTVREVVERFGKADQSNIGKYFQWFVAGSYTQRKGSDTPDWEIKARDLNATGHLMTFGSGSYETYAELRDYVYTKCKNLIVGFYTVQGEEILIEGIGTYEGLDEEFFKNPNQTTFPLSSNKLVVKAEAYKFHNHYAVKHIEGRTR